MSLSNKYSYFNKVAGAERKTRRYVYHISHPKNTKKILQEGLKVRVGYVYEMYTKSKGQDKKDVPPAIFAFNMPKRKIVEPKKFPEYRILGTVLWRIDTQKLPNVWYKDGHFENSDIRIVTFEDIPLSAIKLVN